jgi:hypothetical protein
LEGFTGWLLSPRKAKSQLAYDCNFAVMAVYGLFIVSIQLFTIVYGEIERKTHSGIEKYIAKK